MLIPIRTVAPSALKPVISLAEAKRHLRVEEDGGDEDELIMGYVAAATQYLDGYEGVLGRALVTQTWSAALSCWPCQRWRLPVGPVQSVTSVTYRDSANEQQTFAAANYAKLEDALGPYLSWISGVSFPSLYAREDAATVTWVAGYGDPVAVPETIKHIIRLLVGHWYDNRQVVNIGNLVNKIPFSVEALIAVARRNGF